MTPYHFILTLQHGVRVGTVTGIWNVPRGETRGSIARQITDSAREALGVEGEHVVIFFSLERDALT